MQKVRGGWEAVAREAVAQQVIWFTDATETVTTSLSSLIIMFPGPRQPDRFD